MSKSSFLQLFKLQGDAVPKFNVDASGDDVKMYSSGNFKFEKDVSIKSGVASYINIGVKFSDLDTYNTNFYQQWADQVSVTEGHITTEAKSRTDGDSKLTTDLQTEKTSRENADNLFQSALSSEIATRSTNDTKQANDLLFEVGRAGAQEGVLLGLVNSEAKTRGDADVALGLRVDGEAKTRGDNDSAEAKTRGDADVALGLRIDGEAKTRGDNDSAEAKTRGDADVALGSRITTELGALSTRVDNLTVNLDGAKLDSLSEIVSRMNATGLDVYSRLALLEDIVGILRNNPIYAIARGPYVSDTPASL